MIAESLCSGKGLVNVQVAFFLGDGQLKEWSPQSILQQTCALESLPSYPLQPPYLAKSAPCGYYQYFLLVDSAKRPGNLKADTCLASAKGLLAVSSHGRGRLKTGISARDSLLYKATVSP